MQTAWRERSPAARVKGAHDALEKNADCAPAYILLAEEEATTIAEAEKLLRQALKSAETNYRYSQQNQHLGTHMEVQHRRDTNVLIYIKRRLAMCARKLGKLKEAVKMFRDVSRSLPLTNLQLNYILAFFVVEGLGSSRGSNPGIILQSRLSWYWQSQSRDWFSGL